MGQGHSTQKKGVGHADDKQVNEKSKTKLPSMAPELQNRGNKNEGNKSDINHNTVL